MEPIQASLWKGILADLSHLERSDQFEPSKSKELKTLYDEMCKNFSDTLPGSQQNAFKKLSNMANTIFSDSQATGIAFGIYVAWEMRKFLSHPEKALQASSDSYPPISKILEVDIQALYSYFSTYKQSVCTRKD